MDIHTHIKTIVNTSSGSGSLSGCYEEVLLQTQKITKSSTAIISKSYPRI